MGKCGACSACCLYLSITGTIFLIIIGGMFQTQPMFTAPDVEDPGAAATACFNGALIYFIFIFVSLFGSWYDKRHEAAHAPPPHRPAAMGVPEEAAGLLAEQQDRFGTYGTS